jgi:hypothetical protein
LSISFRERGEKEKVSKLIPGRGHIASYVIIIITYIYAPKGDKLSGKIKVVYDGVRKRWCCQGEEKIISYGVMIF